MTALRFQTRGRHQTSPVDLRQVKARTIHPMQKKKKPKKKKPYGRNGTLVLYYHVIILTLHFTLFRGTTKALYKNGTVRRFYWCQIWEVMNSLQLLQAEHNQLQPHSKIKARTILIHHPFLNAYENNPWSLAIWSNRQNKAPIPFANR